MAVQGAVDEMQRRADLMENSPNELVLRSRDQRKFADLRFVYCLLNSSVRVIANDAFRARKLPLLVPTDRAIHQKELRIAGFRIKLETFISDCFPLGEASDDFAHVILFFHTKLR